MKIIYTNDVVELDKRFYAPIKVKDNCSKCNLEVEINYFYDSYLSYPIANSPFKINFYCNGCRNEWYSQDVILRIKLEEFNNTDASKK